MSRNLARPSIGRAARTRRLALYAIATLALSESFVTATWSSEQMRAVRIWPAQDYTRVTIESDQPLRHSLLLLKNPERLALDLEDVDPSSVQQSFAGKVLPNDPHIASLRVGRFKPGVTRVAIDLKTEVKPQIFVLAPVGDYGHRLVLDIYPLEPVDPLMALLQKPEPKPEPALERKEEGTPNGKQTQERVGPLNRLVTIAIDAGHGGEDPGAKGRRGTFEKAVTLTIARKLRTLINEDSKMRAVLTRDGDYFIPLDVRVEKANRIQADLFVSIHADAFVKIIAQRENSADLIGGMMSQGKDRYVQMTLADLKLTAQISDSLKLGRAVLGELGGVNSLHRGKVEQAGFAVLKAPDIPSILVETAFISNPEEERRLNDEAYQEKIARAILRGIKGYVAKNPPLSRSTLAAADLR